MNDEPTDRQRPERMVFMPERTCVRYTGRLTHHHGLYRAYRCVCRECTDHDWGCRRCAAERYDECRHGSIRYRLSDGTVELDHASWRSLEVLDPARARRAATVGDRGWILFKGNPRAAEVVDFAQEPDMFMVHVGGFVTTVPAAAVRLWRPVKPLPSPSE